MTPEDVLKYALARTRDTQGWALDAVGDCGHPDGHDDMVSALIDEQCTLRELAAQVIRDPERYSNGRAVQTTQEIVPGLYTGHVWHPLADAEEPYSWRAALPSDPGVPSPGVYEVTVDPARQDIHVRVIRLAGDPA